MILLIDTTTNPAAIGIWDGKDLKLKIIESNPENNRKLVGIIRKFIGMTDDSPSKRKGRLSSITPKELTAIGVVNGPGTFTGVRTGVTIANTIAYALKIPIYTIDTLSVGVDPRVDPNAGKHRGLPLQELNNVISILSASNTEVYFVRFSKGKMAGKIEIVESQNLNNRLKDGDLIVGDLQEKHCGIITKQEFIAITSLNRVKNLLNMILCKKLKPVKMTLPLYIKKPNITVAKKIRK